MEFRPMPKTPRFSREIVITEKIDGTNASVNIVDFMALPEWDFRGAQFPFEGPDRRRCPLTCGSCKTNHYPDAACSLKENP